MITAYGLNLVPQVITDGTGASDHASFWNQSYPAILAIEDYNGTHDFNPNYHTGDDMLWTIRRGLFHRPRQGSGRRPPPT